MITFHLDNFGWFQAFGYTVEGHLSAIALDSFHRNAYAMYFKTQSLVLSFVI
jgi:hypothetical protein